ncbi:hypothetical protein [Bartonella sp. DGB2]|uniref:hypothetical protein n=1 Tax=Bartonella sp. DGB2 TaxID=3388426 RepID=UPI00399013A4
MKPFLHDFWVSASSARYTLTRGFSKAVGFPTAGRYAVRLSTIATLMLDKPSHEKFQALFLTALCFRSFFRYGASLPVDFDPKVDFFSALRSLEELKKHYGKSIFYGVWSALSGEQGRDKILSLQIDFISLQIKFISN